MSEEVTHSSSVSLHRGAPCWEYNHRTFGVSDSLSYPTEAQFTLPNTLSEMSKMLTFDHFHVEFMSPGGFQMY